MVEGSEGDEEVVARSGELDAEDKTGELDAEVG